MIRKATFDDLTDVVSWITSARDCEFWAGWRVSFPIDPSRLPSEIGFSEHGGYVWLANDQVVAFGQIVQKPTGRKHLARIIVKPEMRRRGYGEAFVRALLALSAQCVVVSLNVDAQNMGAISLYERLGFVDASRPVDEPISPGTRYMERK